MFMLISDPHKSEKGQTLIEVLVAIVMISGVLVAFLSALTNAAANLQYSRNKTQATKYAQEAIEYIRTQRDFNTWSDFYTGIDGKWCMSTLDWPPSTPTPCSAPISDQYAIFYREAAFTLNDPDNDRVTIEVVVTWTQGARTSQVILDTYLTQW